MRVIYIEKLELLVICLEVVGVKKEIKDKIRSDFMTKTGIKKVIVVEGTFEIVK